MLSVGDDDDVVQLILKVGCFCRLPVKVKNINGIAFLMPYR